MCSSRKRKTRSSDDVNTCDRYVSQHDERFGIYKGIGCAVASLFNALVLLGEKPSLCRLVGSFHELKKDELPDGGLDPSYTLGVDPEQLAEITRSLLPESMTAESCFAERNGEHGWCEESALQPGALVWVEPDRLTHMHMCEQARMPRVAGSHVVMVQSVCESEITVVDPWERDPERMMMTIPRAELASVWRTKRANGVRTKRAAVLLHRA